METEMQVTAADVKKLREETGAGIMDAKRALELAISKLKTQNSKLIFEEAKKEITKRGIAKADKKADRETGVARVYSYVHFNGKVGSLIQLACETDFVANTEDFATLGKELAMQVASQKPKNDVELLAQDYLRNPKVTVEQLIKELSGKTGENIRIVGFSCMG